MAGTGIEIETGTGTMNPEAMTIIVKTITARYSMSGSIRGDKITMTYSGGKMKNILLAALLLALALIVPSPAMAAVDISVNIGLPPAIVFSGPPDVIVMPDTTDVYIVPDIDEDLFFWNGWWWRFWEGRWYRSHYYDRNWRYYSNVPSFYYDVDPGWRGYYRDRNWYGHSWNYERIPHRRLQQNWKSWRSNRYWERQGTWGIQDYRPRPRHQRQELRQQRLHEYQQRPEVQQQRRPQDHRPRVREQRHDTQDKIIITPQKYDQRRDVRQERHKPEEKNIIKPQKYEQRPEVRQPRQQPQEKARQQHSRPQEKSGRDDDDRKDRR